MRVAVLGDIHGNLYGLQAALADLRTQSPDALVISGDLIYKLPWSVEVVDLARELPCMPILGNAELYVTLWGTELWPDSWEEPRMIELVQWERAQLGHERLRWLAQLPEYASFSAGRLDDLLIVHGVPGNPFLPFLARPGEDQSPWVQTDQRAQQLLGGADSDVLVCGHTHSVLRRTVRRADGGETLIISPGSLSYGRGREKEPGRADYALLEWSHRAGWQVALRAVRYDPAPLWQALLRFREEVPLAAVLANRLRPPRTVAVPEPVAPDYIRYRWGDAPLWWERRDELRGWRALRGEEED
jgi:predicted phosphodiesterase